MTLRADIARVATLRITTAHHLFDCLLYVGALVGRNLFPAIIPPTLSVINEDLAESVTSVLRRGMKQQDCRCSIDGVDQHSLVGVGETGIIPDRAFRLSGMVLDLTVFLLSFQPFKWKLYFIELPWLKVIQGPITNCISD